MNVSLTNLSGSSGYLEEWAWPPGSSLASYGPVSPGAAVPSSPEPSGDTGPAARGKHLLRLQELQRVVSSTPAEA